MKLTNQDAWHCFAGGCFAADDKNAWHCFAGGCFAADDKNAWQAKTTIGDYSIQPISADHNCDLHIGYQVHFLNVKGKVGRGLWQPLGKLCNLREARRRCQNHMIENGGEIYEPELAAA